MVKKKIASLEECTDEIRQIVNNVARKREHKAVIMSQIPHRHDKPHLNEKIDVVNDFIKRELHKHNYWHLLQRDLEPQDYKHDGLHFNQRGTAKYAHEIRHLIRKLNTE